MRKVTSAFVSALGPVTALGVVAALGLVACADDPTVGPTGATGGTGATAPSATTGATTGATGSPSPPTAPALEDGRHFGFIQSVDADAGTVVFDLAYWLEGEEAAEAAAEHGDEVPPPNDYYVVNDNPKVRTLRLADDLRIVLLDWERCCDETIEPDLDLFADVIAEGGFVRIDGRLYYGTEGSYWLTVEGGEVRTIEEQYRP